MKDVQISKVGAIHESPLQLDKGLCAQMKFFIVVLLALSLWDSPARALESMVITYPTTSSQFVPLWFARDVGLYEKYGIDAKLVFIQGGSVLLQAMVAGQAQAAQNGVAETVTAILRGGDVRMLGVTSKIFPYTMVVAKNIKSAKDLIGGKLASIAWPM